MSILQIIPFAHSLIKQTVADSETVIDCTAGNGNDTLFLAKLVGAKGRVYAFDIQEPALQKTQTLFATMSIPLNNVTLINDNHACLNKYINAKKKIAASIFNLGYLPGGDKSIVTTAHSTITALNFLLTCTRPQGIIILILYSGHKGGKAECSEVLKHTETIARKEADVLQYRFHNYVNNPPFLLAIQKK